MPVSDIDPVFDAAAKEWNVDPALLRAVSAQESRGNAAAVSSKGARGLMGVMPDTAKGLGVTDPADPVQNIYAGAKYLSEALDKEKTPEDALRYYHGGPDWRKSYGPESQGYAPAVTAHYQKFAKPAAAANDDGGMSDAEFLKRTAGSSDAAPGVEDDAAFKARTGAVTPKAETAAAPTGLDKEGRPEWTDESGAPIGHPAAPVQALGRVGAAAVEGARAGFGNPLTAPNPVLTDQGQAVLDRLQAGGGVTGGLAQLGSMVAGDVGTGINILKGAGGAVLGAYQGGVAQVGQEVGQPQLGRDLAALPEAFPTGEAGTNALRRPSVEGMVAKEVARRAAEAKAYGAPARELFAARSADDRLIMAPPDRSALTAPTQAPAVTIPPQAMPLTALDPAYQVPQPGMGPVPQSVGAAASRDTSHPSVIDMSPAEMKANRRQAEKAELLAPPERGDTTIHVEGSLPTKAEYTGDPVVSQQEIMLRQRNPGAFADEDGRLSANTAARIKAYEDMTPSDTAIETMKADRARQAKADTAAIMQYAKPADLSPALKAFDDVLNDQRIKERDAVISVLGPLREKLFDADGNLKTDPQSVWGIHDNLMNKLETAKDRTSTERFVIGELNQIKQAVDGVMNTATDGHFQTFLDNYAAKSSEINGGNLLREFRDKFTNSKGQIMGDRFHKWLLDQAERRGDPGLDPAMDIPDETMRGLISIDKDMKRAGLIELGKPLGSPTDLYGSLAKGMGIGAAHIGMAIHSPGVGNLLLHHGGKMAEGAFGNMRLKSKTNAHLAPPPGGYRHPLDAP